MKVVRVTGQADIPWTPDIQRLLDVVAFGSCQGGAFDDSSGIALTTGLYMDLVGSEIEILVVEVTDG